MTKTNNMACTPNDEWSTLQCTCPDQRFHCALFVLVAKEARYLKTYREGFGQTGLMPSLK